MKDWIFTEAVNLLHEGNNAKAAQILAKYIKRYPEDVQAWLMLSDALEEKKKIEFALNKVLEIEPNNPIALEKYEQLKNNQAGTTFFDSALIDLETPLNPHQSQAFVYIPEYDRNQSKDEIAQNKDLPVLDLDTPETEEKVSRPKEQDDTAGHKFLSTFFALLLVIAILIGIYISKSVWVPKLMPYLPPSAQIYLEKFSETYNVFELPHEINLASTEVAAYQNPSATPINTPTAIPTLTVNQNEAMQIAETINQLKLRSDSSFPPLIESTEAEINRIAQNNTSHSIGIKQEKQTLVAFGLLEPTFDLEIYYSNTAISPQAVYNPENQSIQIAGDVFSPKIKADYASAYLEYLQSFGTMNKPSITSLDSFDQKLAMLGFYQGDSYFTQLLVQENYPSEEKTQIIPQDFTYTNWATPLYLFNLNNFIYQYGISFIQAVYDSGQMLAVQALYTNPPETTEQLLHLDKYYTNEVGTIIMQPELQSEFGPAWMLSSENQLGEWRTMQVLASNSKSYARLDQAVAQTAATGWNGDHFQVYTNPETEEYILVVHWMMDTELDATELTTALNQVNRARFSQGTSMQNNTLCHLYGNETSCVFQSDRHVVWLISPDESFIPTIMAQYPSIQ